jgi:hypothetical protein
MASTSCFVTKGGAAALFTKSSLVGSDLLFYGATDPVARKRLFYGVVDEAVEDDVGVPFRQPQQVLIPGHGEGLGGRFWR